MERNIAIVICYSKRLKNESILCELSLGIEEEGLPCILKMVDSDRLYELSTKASFDSDLDVGIGVDASGHLGLHQTKLPDGMLLFEESATMVDGRSYGSNAARLIKGIPFKEYKERMDHQ